MYRKFNIVLCAIFTFIQWTVFCSEQEGQIQKFQINPVAQKVEDFCHIGGIKISDKRIFFTQQNDKGEEETKGEFELNKENEAVLEGIKSEEENIFSLQNTMTKENFYAAFKLSKEEIGQIKECFKNKSISNRNNNNRISSASSISEDEDDKAAKYVLDSINVLMNNSKEQEQRLVELKKQIEVLEEQKKSNKLNDSETKTLTLQIQQLKKEQEELKEKFQSISDTNDSLIENCNKQIEEKVVERVTKLEEQKILQEKFEKLLRKYKNLKLLMKNNMEYIEKQLEEAQKKPKRLDEEAAEDLQELLDEINAKELERKNSETIKEEKEKEKDKVNIIDNYSGINFSIYDESQNITNTATLKNIRIKSKDNSMFFGIGIQEDNFIIIKDEDCIKLQTFIKQQEANKDIKILFELQTKNDEKVSAVFTVGEEEKMTINSVVEVYQKNGKPNGWSKTRIFAAGGGILGVLFGVLGILYLNHHNLTFSNVFHVAMNK